MTTRLLIAYTLIALSVAVILAFGVAMLRRRRAWQARRYGRRRTS